VGAVEEQRQHLDVAEADLLQLARVEAADRHHQVGLAGQRAGLPAAAFEVVRISSLRPRKNCGRGDVVVEDGLAAGQGGQDLVGRRADGEVEQGHVARPDLGRGLGQVAGQRAQLGQGALLLAVDLGGEAPGAEQLLQHAGLVADRVAVGETGHELVEGTHGRDET
jgi:hypothetical protein